MSAPLRPFPVRNADPDDWRDAGRVEHAQKFEQIAQALGVSRLLAHLPREATPERVKAALEAGDEPLNTLPLSCWDRAIGYGGDNANGRSSFNPPAIFRGPHPLPPNASPGWTMSPAECVCTLKHVARYHLPFGG